MKSSTPAIQKNNGDVAMKINYSKNNIGVLKRTGMMFHRRDYHEDGSATDWYGIELSKDEFLAAGGVEIPEVPVTIAPQDFTKPDIT